MLLTRDAGTCQLIGPGSNALRAEASDWIGHRTVPIDTGPVPQLKYGRTTDRPLRGPDTRKNVSVDGQLKVVTLRYVLNDFACIAVLLCSV